MKAAALELGLAVTDDLAEAVEVGAELGVVVAYGRIIPVAVLDRLPMVNLHFSLLPRWRGAAPVERALLEGDAETGVCLMAVEAGLDTGGVYAEEATAIDDEETADELRARLVAIGCRLLEEHLAGGHGGPARPRDQAGNPTYAEKIQSARARARLGAARPSSSAGWSGSAGPGPRSGAAACGCLAVVAGPGTATGAATGQRLGPGTLDGVEVGAGGGSRLRWSPCSRRGGGPWTPSDWLRGVRPGPGERLGATEPPDR